MFLTNSIFLSIVCINVYLVFFSIFIFLKHSFFYGSLIFNYRLHRFKKNRFFFRIFFGIVGVISSTNPDSSIISKLVSNELALLRKKKRKSI